MLYLGLKYHSKQLLPCQFQGGSRQENAVGVPVCHLSVDEAFLVRDISSKHNSSWSVHHGRRPAISCADLWALPHVLPNKSWFSECLSRDRFLFDLGFGAQSRSSVRGSPPPSILAGLETNPFSLLFRFVPPRELKKWNSPGCGGGIRDLMSPVISEQHYKNGMKKDENGFMDIDWCCSKVLNDWDELRSVFMQANAKKAIAPTQVGAHLSAAAVAAAGVGIGGGGGGGGCRFCWWWWSC